MQFGDSVGFLASGGQDIDGIMKALEDSAAFSTLSGIQPLLVPLLLLRFGHPAKGILNFAKKMKERAASTKGSAEKDGGNTFQQKLDAAFERDPETYKMYHMDVAADGNVAAGSDTTSISLTGALYYIITTTGVLKKLRDEIADVLGPEAAENSVTFEQASGMPYLQNCIKEALRLHSATGLPLWREIVGEGVKIAGTTFPPGVRHPSFRIFGFLFILTRNRQSWASILGWLIGTLLYTVKMLMSSARRDGTLPLRRVTSLTQWRNTISLSVQGHEAALASIYHTWRWSRSFLCWFRDMISSMKTDRWTIAICGL